jgi:DNA topoisomerase-1
MAKKAAGGKSLVIVESPAKARTISRFLGPGFDVEASIGHVRDLPQGAKEMPAELKKEKWAYLGVNVDADFEPVYIVPPTKKSQVAKLKALLKDAKDLYLATDEDREGEAISWHLLEILKPKVPVHRLVFHEITEEAIKDALASPRSIDDGMVRAQETRRILDRLYGYDVSQLLWRKVRPRLSAGRVQSVAVRIIVERERERRAFVSATYWDLLAKFATAGGKEIQAELISVDGKRIPVGKDFDANTGKLKNPGQFVLMNEQQATDLRERLSKAKFTVTSIEDRPYTRKPAEPFTTSTLQQEANRKLGFTAKRTMDVAQRLYVNSKITYMRTDSTNLAQVAIDAARDLVRSEYGAEYLPDSPRIYRSKVKNAQEAHEAIRPAGHPFQKPEALRNELDNDEFRLFELIWKRTIACQMVDARGHNITLQIEADGAVFQATGKTIDFAGFLRAYVEGSDDPEAELSEQERILPSVSKGEGVDCQELGAKSHATQPPARYSEASLTAALEQLGIGRPSTYASIIGTIVEREYVFKKGNALVPTWTAFAVCKLLEVHLPQLVDYQFTAQMEDLLDAISRQEQEWTSFLKHFYFGNGDPGLKPQIETKLTEIDPRDISRFPLGKPDTGLHREEVVLRVGKYGPFVEQGDRKASVPDGMAPDELSLEKAMELLDQQKNADSPLGIDPKTERPVFLKVGRFGPYVQLGPLAEDEKPKNSSVPKSMRLEDVTLELALKLLELPRVVGQHPTDQQDIVAHDGRYGPYIKWNAETRSLPKDVLPIDVTLQQAIDLLAQPKQNRGRGAPQEPLKVYEKPSPVTEGQVKVLSGRYGNYVTDGTTNATVPKDVKVEELTFDQALQLLADRAALGPPKGRRGRAAPKKAAKAAAPKKAAKTAKATKKAAKKAPAKKAAKKGAKSDDDGRPDITTREPEIYANPDEEADSVF